MLRSSDSEEQGTGCHCVSMHFDMQQCGISSEQYRGQFDVPVLELSLPGGLFCRSFLEDEGTRHSTILGFLQKANQ